MKIKITNKSKFDCPFELLKFILLVNELKVEDIDNLKNVIQREIPKLDERLKNEGVSNKFLIQLYIDFKDVVNQSIVSKLINAYLLSNNTIGVPEWHRALDRFHELLTAKEVLNLVADYNLNGDPDEIFEGWNLRNWLDKTPVQGFLHVNAFNYLKPTFSEFMTIFDRYDVYYKNIRKCVVCENIFWAKREKSKTCSKSCSNTLINRNYRKENKERISQNRKNAREAKKQLARAKEKINKDGTL